MTKVLPPRNRYAQVFSAYMYCTRHPTSSSTTASSSDDSKILGNAGQGRAGSYCRILLGTYFCQGSAGSRRTLRASWGLGVGSSLSGLLGGKRALRASINHQLIDELMD